MASSSEASCISDPNFAVICAFLERFAKSCGITYPSFAELQEMLENAEQVPQELIELHIKLLRKARKTVFLEKWERALIKFCHTYSSQDGWEIERFGYKKSRLEVKLRVLKMLLEGQFDLNNKFKASINTLESEELRAKPLGKDKLGRIYWLQFDPLSNIRVYREDLDEESWTLVARDRATLVQLLQELSGEEFPINLNVLNEDSNSLEISKPTLDTGQIETSDYNILNDSFKQNDETIKVIVEKDSLEAKNKESFPKKESEKGLEDLKNFQTSNKISDSEEKTDQGNNENEAIINEVDLDKDAVNMYNGKAPIKDEVVVGEAIEEPIMYVTGEGKGEDCNTGNPDNEEKSEECSKSITSDRLTNKQATGAAQDPSEVDSLSSVNSPDKSKPTPKLWSIDAICGVNSSKETDSEVYNIDRQESSDGKLIQKNFSKFSIDSVLEKKDLNSVFSDGSLTKFPVISPGDSLPDKLQCNELDSSSLKIVRSDEDNEKPTSVKDSQVVFCSVNFKTENLTEEVEKEKLINEMQTPKCLENISNEREQNLRENFSDILSVKEDLRKSSEEQTEFKADKREETSEEKREKSKNEVEFYPLKNLAENEVIKTKDISIENDLLKSDDISEEESNTGTKENKVVLAVTKEIVSDEKSQTKCLEGVEEKESTHLYSESFQERNLQSDSILTEQTQMKNGKFLEAKMEENPQSVDETVLPSVNVVENCDTEGILGSNKILFSWNTGEKGLEKMETDKAETIKMNDATEIAESFKSEVEEVNAENNDNRTVEDQDLCHNVDIEKCKNEKVENSSEKDPQGFIKDESIKSEMNENLLSCNDSNENEGKTSLQELDNSKDEAEGNKKTKQTRDEKLEEEAVVHNERAVVRTSQNSENSSKEDKIEELLKMSDNVTEEDEMTACESSKVTRRRKKEVVPQRISLRNRRITEGENLVHESSDKTVRSKGGRRGKLKESDGFASDSKDNKNKTKDVEDEFEKAKTDETETRKQLSAEKEMSIETCEIEDVKQVQQKVVVNKKVRKRFSRKHRKRRRRNVEEEVVGDVQDKGGKQSKSSQEEDKEDAKNKKKGRPKREETAGRSKSRQIAAREIKLLGIKDADTELPSIRQSRRIAQIKMKEEAERRRMEALQLESFKNKKNKSKTGKKKQRKNADSDSFEEKYDKEECDSSEEKLKPNKDDKKARRRKKKDKMVFNELNPWLSSSGSSSADEEEDEIDDEPHEDEELVFKSDHEFSPESDIEDPDYKPIKRARTAKVEESKDDAGKYDDTACEKCGNNDHPEWILLCDKCDKGWHASCVRPALMVVPEGDWFCPPCEHSALIQRLQESLAQYDRCQKQRENEELRKKRLAFVGISLDNVLPSTKKKSSKHEDEDREEADEGNKEDLSGSDSGSESENSYSSSRSDESSEPVYQLRERRSTVTSYRYNEYDELIKSALQDEIEAVKGAGNAGRGKDINNIVNAPRDIKEEEGDKEQVKKKVCGSENMEVDWKHSVGENVDKESCQNDGYKVENDGLGNDTDGEDEEEDENIVDEIPPVVPKYNNNSNKKKKSKSSKITSLDFTSEEEDHNSDSDFKGTSSEEESDCSFLSESESSDDTRRRKKSGEGPLRRSTRARVSRYDRDFINDESEEDSPKRKKHRKVWISSESSDSDRSWGRRKRKGNRSLYRSSKKKSPKKGKRKKQKKELLDSENEGSMTTKKSKNRKIKYGGLDCLDEEKVLTRRTRGKKINYQEMNGSDSDEDTMRNTKKSSRVIESDDDFVAENEKDDDVNDRESEEVESSVDEDCEDGQSGEKNSRKRETGSNGKRNKILEKIKKKKWVIPDPDDFSENDLMEDEQLDEFVEELEDLDEEEEEILGNIIESGDVPINELKAAIKRAKEERRLKKEEESKEKLILDNNSVQISEPSVAYMPVPSDCANAGSGKFPKIGKVKITPSRAELASQFGGMQTQIATPLSGKPINFIQSTTGSFVPEKSGEGLGPTPPKEKHSDSGNSVGGFLLRTLQSDQKPVSVSNINIPSNHSAVKDEASVLRRYASYSVETAQSSSLNVMSMINPQSPGGPGDNGCANMIPMSVNSGCSIPQYNAFQGIAPPSRMPSYPATIPTTVTGLSNADQLRRKPGPKPGTKNKRKMDELSSELDSCGDSSESGDIRSTIQQGDEFIALKGVQDSPPKKKGRGRGKKQLLAEAQAKQDVTAPLVQTSYPPQGLPSEGGSVITRMLSTPQGSQTFPGNDSNRFSPGPRNRLPFRPTLPPHFANSPRAIGAVRLRSPAAGNSIFHTSHPLDPSPSGGGAISIPVTSSGLTKPPAGSTFNRAPGMTMVPRFPSDPNIRHPFSSQNSPPRPEFSSFPSYYGNFPPQSSSVSNNEDSSFTNPSFPESFEESQISGNSKSFEDETGGEFGGLASYFASQREDDLDT